MDCDTWPLPLIDLSEPTDFCVNGCTIPANTDPDLLDSLSVQAGIILRVLSGGRVGTCEDTLRPLSECYTCRGTCHCGSGDRIRLWSSQGPVTAVTTVKVNGVEVDDESWRFYPSGQLLYRVPPEVWPYRDNKSADCDDDGTMCVDATIGNSPDAWAQSVHAELVCELLKSCGTGPCRIPKNATQVSGQGVTVTLTPTELKQFIPSVAGWVAAVNPDNAQQPTKLFSPDIDRPGW